LSQEQTINLAEHNGSTPLALRLVYATLILIALNFAIVLWFLISPNERRPDTRSSLPQKSYKVQTAKGSPFEPARTERTPKLSRVPPKLEPVTASAGSVN